MKLKGKVAIVTGSSKGIGRATAVLFAKEGAKVVVNHTSSPAEAGKVVEEIQKLGSDAISVRCDVSQEKDVEQMMAETVEKFGKIDILVNNAGIVTDLPFKKRTVEHWKRTLEVNLIGTFLCARHAAPHMGNHGKIVNVASTNGIDSFSPEAMDYDASKAGVLILTRDLAKELAPGIQVNAVAPGWVDTEMNKDLPESFIKEETEKIYMKRFASPEEIAAVILFLVSGDASYITGSTLKVDGGYG